MENVIIELVVAAHLTGASLMAQISDRLPEVTLDAGYEPVEMIPSDEDLPNLSDDQKVVVVRGTIVAGTRASLDGVDGILHIWSDGKVAPFDGASGGDVSPGGGLTMSN